MARIIEKQATKKVVNVELKKEFKAEVEVLPYKELGISMGMHCSHLKCYENATFGILLQGIPGFEGFDYCKVVCYSCDEHQDLLGLWVRDAEKVIKNGK